MKFDGTTEQRAQYVPKRVEQGGGDPNSKQPSEKWWEKTKFNGDTEMRTAYTPKELERTEKQAYQKPQVRRPMVHIEPSLGEARDSHDSRASCMTGSSLGHDRGPGQFRN